MALEAKYRFHLKWKKKGFICCCTNLAINRYVFTLKFSKFYRIHHKFIMKTFLSFIQAYILILKLIKPWSLVSIPVYKKVLLDTPWLCKECAFTCVNIPSWWKLVIHFAREVEIKKIFTGIEYQFQRLRDKFYLTFPL